MLTIHRFNGGCTEDSARRVQDIILEVYLSSKAKEQAKPVNAVKARVNEMLQLF